MQLYSGGIDCQAVEWSLAASKFASHAWIAHESAVSAVAVAATQPVLATACNTITLWHREQRTELCRFSGHASPTRVLAFAPNDHYLLSAYVVVGHLFFI